MARAEITYLYHSGFAVKTANRLLVFDYFPSNEKADAAIDSLIADNVSLRATVFASHGHADHFNPRIFEWKKQIQEIHYVLSSDISHGHDRTDTTMVQPGLEYTVDGISVKALESTDLGVAFLIQCDGLTIYHAGDLNWWHWEGEPDEDNRDMALAYKSQIDQLKGLSIDIAFVPVDPRLEDHYALGLQYFMDVVGAELIFPMHFGEEYSIFGRLKKDIPISQAQRIIEIAPARSTFKY